MSKSSLSNIDCSIAQCLSVIGEWWALMILRNAFLGVRKFDDFQSSLGISTSVLSARLKTLTRAGVLERRPSLEDGRSVEYCLTSKGFDLYPVIVGMKDWGEKWAPNGRGQRLELIEKTTGKPISGAAVMSEKGEPLQAWQVSAVAGPGIDPVIQELLNKRKKR